jgi:hypothetical protein
MQRVLPVVQRALQAGGMAPEREASPVATSPRVVAGAPLAGAMAGTARRRQRPPAATQQREHDSGKKQTHTDTTIVLVHETTDTVVYRGPTVGGKTHAKKAADAAAIAYPPHATGAKDTGFQGYEPAGVQTRQPKQKPRNQELSGAERRLN